jgi:hypothetical protein
MSAVSSRAAEVGKEAGLRGRLAQFGLATVLTFLDMVHDRVKMLGGKAVVGLLALGSGLLSACGNSASPGNGLYTWTDGVPSTAGTGATGGGISVPLLAGPFVVSDYFAPTTHVADAAIAGHVMTGLPCKERPDGARGKCYRFDYLPGEQGWAAVYFMPKAGGPDPLSLSLDNLHSISFQAAAMVSAQAAQFMGGGIMGGLGTRSAESSDQFKVETSATLDTAWQKVQIQLPIDAEPPVTRLVGAFGWSMRPSPSNAASPPAALTLFLDDIVYE